MEMRELGNRAPIATVQSKFEEIAAEYDTLAVSRRRKRLVAKPNIGTKRDMHVTPYPEQIAVLAGIATTRSYAGCDYTSSPEHDERPVTERLSRALARSLQGDSWKKHIG